VKLVLLVFNVVHGEEIRNLLEDLKAPGFTEMPQVYGTGDSGKRFGSHTWPGHGTLIFSVLPDNQAERLAAAVERLKSGLSSGRAKRGGPRLFLLGVERVV
jgi:hypothetical protein